MQDMDEVTVPEDSDETSDETTEVSMATAYKWIRRSDSDFEKKMKAELHAQYKERTGQSIDEVMLQRAQEKRARKAAKRLRK